MSDKTSLARRLAEKKNQDLNTIAEELCNKICRLADLCYRDSSIVLKFYGGGFFREAAIQMIPPKELQKKLKLLEKKEQTVSSVSEQENEELESENSNEEIQLDESEKLLLNIIEQFNDIETTVRETATKSKEQTIVLKELEALLQQENFEVKSGENYIEIIWWK